MTSFPSFSTSYKTLSGDVKQDDDGMNTGNGATRICATSDLNKTWKLFKKYYRINNQIRGIKKNYTKKN